MSECAGGELGQRVAGLARVDADQQLSGAHAVARLDPHVDDLARRERLDVHRQNRLDRSGGGGGEDDVAPGHDGGLV